ncbi:MAG: ATP-binding cassette domain-containing protein [Propionibacteriales bacterium]|nr:ATP-binding cassette domain-containing protein [Propionibacteriales bacterium]
MSVITTLELTKTYPRVTALDRLSVSVASGITGLVGANGAGKSTLIKILLGLLPPNGGSASVLGFNIANQGSEIRARVGYMPEHDCLPPDVSASELVVHMARMSGLPLASARERAADVLRHVGLYEERYRPIGGYSTGMRQRVKLAQALVHDPLLVFLDEPTNGLDPQARDEMLDLIRRIGSEFGIAVLVTSHLLGELERISDYVIILDSGRLLRASSTAEFLVRTGVLHVEVQGPPEANDMEVRDRLGHALHQAGLYVWPDGRGVAVRFNDESVFDLIRDTTVDLGLGLVRLEQGHHRIEDVFREEVAGHVPPA